MILKEVLGLEELPAQLSWGVATQQQYAQVTMQVKERLRSILNLDGFRIIVAREREFNMDSESDIVMPCVAAAFTPSLVGWLNPACDYIGQTFLRPKMKTKTIKIGGKSQTTEMRGKGMDYCLRTAPHDVFTTKFRAPVGNEVPEYIVDPSYEKIVGIVQGG